MVGVFFMSQRMRADGLEDGTVYLFADRTAADDFIFTKLVEIGDIEVIDEGIEAFGEPQESKTAAIEFCQDCCDTLEFFHGVKAVDMRCEKPAGTVAGS